MNLFKKDEKILNKFLNFSLLNNKEISWCPTPNCDYGFIWKKEDPEFACPKCLKTYCLKCQCEFHTGITCKDYYREKESEKADEIFLKVARNSKFKQCPECKKWIEKNEGCNHITCKCKYEFCYICGQKYSSNHGNCTYKFIEPVKPEAKTENKNIKKDAKANKDNSSSGRNSSDLFSSIRKRTSIFNDRDNAEIRANDFNSFNHYSELLNGVFNHSRNDYYNDNSKRDSEQVYSNSKTFTEFKNSKIDERPLQNFFDVSEPIGINTSVIKNKGTNNSQANLFAGHLKKDGTPDMRFAENKDATLIQSLNDSMSTYSTSNNSILDALNFNNPTSVKKSTGPLKKDGTLDMRFAVNKNNNTNESLFKSLSNNSTSKYSNTNSSIPTYASSVKYCSGPLKQDGTPDMRFAVNKNNKANDCSSYISSCTNYTNPSYSNNYSNRSSIGLPLSFTGSSSSFYSGPTKKDGTLDMRYSVNKQNCSNYGNSFSNSNYSSSNYSSSACGPLRKDGQPDMRYAVNKAMYGGKRK